MAGRMDLSEAAEMTRIEQAQATKDRPFMSTPMNPRPVSIWETRIAESGGFFGRNAEEKDAARKPCHMDDAEHKLRLAECAIKKPKVKVDDEVAPDESMTNVNCEHHTEAEAAKENEVREHEHARVETEHERERKTCADADSFMARRFCRAGASIVNKDGIMQINGSKGSRMFRAATGQAESEHMQNEKRRVKEMHEMVPVVETECSRKMGISRLATLFETKRAEVKKDASNGGMSGHAICEKIVVDNSFKALSNVMEFKSDEAVNKEWRAHSEKVPLAFQDRIKVVRDWGNVMPHAELALENDGMPADVSAASEDGVKVLEAEVQSLRSANNALRTKNEKQGAGSRPFQKKTETKKTKAPCRRRCDTTIDDLQVQPRRTTDAHGNEGAGKGRTEAGKKSSTQIGRGDDDRGSHKSRGRRRRRCGVERQ